MTCPPDSANLTRTIRGMQPKFSTIDPKIQMKAVPIVPILLLQNRNANIDFGSAQERGRSRATLFPGGIKAKASYRRHIRSGQKD